MRILVPYDGSTNADIALESLLAPEFAEGRHEILVVVTDVWLHGSAKEYASIRARRGAQIRKSGMSSYAPALKTYEEERFLSRKVLSRLESKLPLSSVRVETLPGLTLVETELLQRADDWEPDLILLGSQRHTVPPRMRSIAGRLKHRVRIAQHPKVSNRVFGSDLDSPAQNGLGNGSQHEVFRNDLLIELPEGGNTSFLKSARKSFKEGDSDAYQIGAA
jgi:nucleotide-binding universal stress UspA family protein